MSDAPTFESLGLADPIMQVLNDVGYEVPSPIQAESIPHFLAGKDLIGQAQTGTGKTAAFALPLLTRMNFTQKLPQVLVLTPTRELAIQVAEAFQRYARYFKDFHVLPIYGGQGYDTQLRQLRRGVQVVVGTPGRVMDHLRRGTLKLNELSTLVLDEADEMLRMGFIDDVEWILERTPDTRQIALFSATMPNEIKRVAEKYLQSPEHIKIAEKTTTAKTIHQRYWQVSGLHKLDALTRILEIESFDAILVFVRTKTITVELAEKLCARGYSCAALNGDIPQNMRENTVERLKNGRLDIVVATDVAARGLDVERISHVINYDIPHDTESYVHRIGRTGRAGRSGEAILFVAPRELRLLKAIERATHQKIEHMKMPSTSDINRQRIIRFKEKITETIADQDLQLFFQLVSEYQAEQEAEPLQIAAALAKLAQGKEPLLLEERIYKEKPRKDNPKTVRAERDFGKRRKQAPTLEALSLKAHPEVPMERYQIAVGHDHEVKPGNIVGAIANEADIDSCYIGHIEICEAYTTVDLPEGMPKETLSALKKAYVCGQKLDIKTYQGGSEDENSQWHRKDKSQSVKKRRFERSDTAKGRKKPKEKSV